MTELSKILPPDLERWVESRVAEGRFLDAGDYLRDLLRREQAEARELEWLREQIAEGMESEIIDREPEDVIEDIIAARRSRHG